jgi:hypothetical protein
VTALDDALLDALLAESDDPMAAVLPLSWFAVSDSFCRLLRSRFPCSGEEIVTHGYDHGVLVAQASGVKHGDQPAAPGRGAGDELPRERRL